MQESADETIAREIRLAIEDAESHIEDLEIQLSKAKEELRRAQNSANCDHEWEDGGSFIICIDRCSKCGWEHIT